MISVCGTYVEQVFLKFSKVNGGYVNERMSLESDRRKNFCESRRKSRQGSNNQSSNKKTYVKRTENVNENETVNEIRDENFGKSENLLLVPEMFEIFKLHNPNYPGSKEKDYRPLFSIAGYLCEQGKLPGSPDIHRQQIIEAWEPICKVIKEDKFYSQKSLSTISNHIQEILQISLHGKSNGKVKYGSSDRAKEFDRLFAERYPKG